MPPRNPLYQSKPERAAPESFVAIRAGACRPGFRFIRQEHSFVFKTIERPETTDNVDNTDHEDEGNTFRGLAALLLSAVSSFLICVIPAIRGCSSSPRDQLTKHPEEWEDEIVFQMRFFEECSLPRFFQYASAGRTRFSFFCRSQRVPAQ